MTLIRWEPFRELDDVFTRYSPFFGRLAAARQAAADEAEAPAWMPVANISETDSEYFVKVELPEVAKEDVKVTIDENVITISGERKKEAEHKDEKIHRVESYYGRYSRSYRLPEDADVAAVEAESRNGVLKVRVPKLPAPKAKTVEVQVN